MTRSVKDVFGALEKTAEPTVILLLSKLQPVPVALFRAKLRKYMDEKFRSSIKALHWMASFLDPTFKSLHFIPQTKREDMS